MSEHIPLRRKPVTPISSSVSEELLQDPVIPEAESIEYVSGGHTTSGDANLPPKRHGMLQGLFRTFRLNLIWNPLQKRNAKAAAVGEAKISVGEARSTPRICGKVQTDGHKQPGIFRILFRTLQMDTIWNGVRRMTGRGSQIEEPKQARIKSVPIAVVSLFAAHLLPLSAALVLLAFNIRGYYIGGDLEGQLGQDDLKLSVLQFAAKAHEVAMQASLGVIIIALVRHELVTGDSGVPFRAIFGSLQFTNISFLISKEFVGMLTAKIARPIVKWARQVQLLFDLAWTTDMPAGGTEFYLNTTRELLWPTQINTTNVPSSCSNITVDTSCPTRNWDTLTPQIISYYQNLIDESSIMPETVRLNGRYAVREMITKQSLGLYRILYSTAVAPMSALADPLAYHARLWHIAANTTADLSKRKRVFYWRKDVIFTIKDVFEPGTATQCIVHNGTKKLQDYTIDFPVSKNLCETGGFAIGDMDYRPFAVGPGAMKVVANFYNRSSTTPEIHFLKLPYGEFGNNTMAAIATLPSSWPGGSQLYGCIIDARWAPAILKSKSSTVSIVTSEITNWPLGFNCGDPIPSIQTTPEWMQYLNPNIQTTNQSVFHTLVQGLGVPPTYHTKQSYQYYQSGIETILSTLMTSALSRVSSDTAVQGLLKGCLSTSDCPCGKWCLSILPKESQEFGYGDVIYDRLPDTSKMMKFTMAADINGYAFNIKGMSMILSCTVLAVYCLLVFIHIALTLFKRSSSSTSFDTVSDVVSLAMQSHPSDQLHHTAAGIQSTKIFSNLVRVITTGEENDHLELDFGDHPTGGCKIVEGKFYS